MNIKCFFAHDWKPIGPLSLIQDNSLSPGEMMQYARCRRCGHEYFRPSCAGGSYATKTRKGYLWQYSREIQEGRAVFGKVGEVGVRDPEFPCADFKPGEPLGECESDGH